MAENIFLQVVVQEGNVAQPRAMAQYGEGFTLSEQKEITYESLSELEKEIYDDFIEMIKSK